MIKIIQFLTFGLLLLHSNLTIAQAKKEYNLIGALKDASSNEAIEYATIRILNQKNIGTTSDEKGEFRFNLSAATYEIEISYIGFEKKKSFIQFFMFQSVS